MAFEIWEEATKPNLLVARNSSGAARVWLAWRERESGLFTGKERDVTLRTVSQGSGLQVPL